MRLNISGRRRISSIQNSKTNNTIHSL